MGVKIELLFPIACCHIAETVEDLLGRHNAQGIGQHEVTYPAIFQLIHHCVNVITAVQVAVRPVLEVRIDLQTFFQRVVYGLQDFSYVLIECLP